MRKIEDVILFQIDRTSKISKRYSQREFDKLRLDITVEQWVLLKIIAETDHLSQSVLADRSFRDPASITRTLDLLEKKNFIKRITLAGNRRTYYIQLTKEGKQFLNNNMSVIKKHRQKSIEGFTQEELKVLSSLLKRIQENMK